MHAPWTLHWRKDGSFCARSLVDPGSFFYLRRREISCSWTVGVQGIIAWPIAKLLEFTLGSHHGIIYRRAGMYLPYIAISVIQKYSSELKELIALHSSVGEYGGDLRSDTVTIIGATLDLQEKTAIHVRSCAYLSQLHF